MHRPEVTKYPLVLRPLLVSRIANMTPGALLVALGAWASFSASTSILWVLMLPGVALMVRAWRLAVVLEADRIAVRGYLWTRQIPRSSVFGLNALDCIVWRTRRGRRRWTPILAFFTTHGPMYPTLPIGTRHAEEQMDRIRTWAHQPGRARE